MKRALLLVLDSVGCGHAPDAAAYGDEGANTLGHLFAQFPELALPNLTALGLGQILGADFPQTPTPAPKAAYGRMREVSVGKDTTTGHWEIAGAPLAAPFATFEKFPPELVDAIEQEGGVRFIGNYPQSGTTILEELGTEHVATGRPILYTSADSVLQIAAHEAVIPLDQLYALCEIARRHGDAWNIGRVIARPFLGEAGAFKRSSHRHDYSMLPPRTILNAVSEANLAVTGIGKISDIFTASGITHSFPTASNAEGMAQISKLWEAKEDGFLFANLVDFDMHFGHRREPAGYAQSLVEFDTWLGAFLPLIEPDDLVIITADHGNDPTHPGTDHTREEVPVFVINGEKISDLGTRSAFSDIAATIARYFELAPWPNSAAMI